MKPHSILFLLLGLAFVGETAKAQQSQASNSRQPSSTAWAPQPEVPTPWVPPNKPHWRLAELRKQHRDEQDWSQDIVKDRDFVGRYVSLGSGRKTRRQFYADDRAFWIVQSGKVRISIDGQPAFVATKGFMVQVPYRTPYSIENIGDEPALRFEVTGAQAIPLYPADEQPAPVPGMKYVKTTYSGRGDYDAINKSYLDFWTDIVKDGARAGAFVSDDHTFVNVIRGRGAAPPPPTNRGHFHVGYSEFWFVIEGKVDYLIEGVPLFTAEEGDVVYAPQGRWHRASFGGAQMATRIAINPRPDGMHNYQPAAE